MATSIAAISDFTQSLCVVWGGVRWGGGEQGDSQKFSSTGNMTDHLLRPRRSMGKYKTQKLEILSESPIEEICDTIG